MRIFFSLLFLWHLAAFAQKSKGDLYGRDHLALRPPPPDYSQKTYWIAHPETQDMADVVPGKGRLKDRQSSAEADVFFIYPTLYAKTQHPAHPWFADVNDEKLNDKIAQSTIKYQATVFNGSARVFAPLYRQAHINIYYRDSTLRMPALDSAYEDVKAAFQYYLDHWHNGRPLIIASHSQGSNHAISLLKDFFEGDAKMRKKLVAAYVVGMPFDKETFRTIPLCQASDDTGCWMGWNTYAKGHYPKDHAAWYGHTRNMNPLSWSLDTAHVSHERNKGGILKNFKKLRLGLSDAQNHAGMLWINKPRFFGNFLLNWDRYHVVDYNLFYLNIRDNVAERVAAYLAQD